MSRANAQLRPLLTKEVDISAIADIDVVLLRVSYANKTSFCSMSSSLVDYIHSLLTAS